MSGGVSFKFDNRVLRSLPVDAIVGTVGPRAVADAFFSLVQPTPLLKPRLVVVSPVALRLLGVEVTCPNPAELPPAMAEALCGMCSGNALPVGAEPAAHCYCGFQFGSFAGQLGDGAAMYLGEVVVGAEDHTAERWELQLKGAGPTPYSRGSDGRKVLRSSVREFLCSEAMHHLNVSTTRAAALVTSDSTVERDPLYSGQSVHERCSVVTRVAQTFLRFGSFEICRRGQGANDRSGPSVGSPSLIARLIDFTAAAYFPSIVHSVRVSVVSDDIKSAVALAVFAEVVRRTAALVAQWQAVGFVHGVLNTDNMSIVGHTIDYGPFAFMSYFDRNFTPNLSDDSGRYAFDQQPSIAKWNLTKLAESFAIGYPSISEALLLAVQEFDTHYAQCYHRRMALMLGIHSLPESKQLCVIEAFLEALHRTGAHYGKVLLLIESDLNPFTGSFFQLDDKDQADRIESRANEVAIVVAGSWCNKPADCVVEAKQKQRRLTPQLPREQILRIRDMLRDEDKWGSVVSSMFNGAPVASVQEFLSKEEESWVKYDHYSRMISDLSAQTAEERSAAHQRIWREFFTLLLTELRETIKSVEDNVCRRRDMAQCLPKFVLYPWILDAAVKKAERGDYSLVQQLTERVSRPFEADDRDHTLWSMEPPSNPSMFLCSCSS